MYTGLDSIFDYVLQPQLDTACFVDPTFWMSPADPTYCSCSSSLLAAYKLNGTGNLLTF